MRQSHPNALSLITLCFVLTAAAGCQRPAQEAPESPEPSGASEPAVTPRMERAGAAVTTQTLRNHIAFLSDDALGGRGPGTQGDETARQYLATRMEELGLQPAFRDSWEQPFELVSVETRNPDTWTFRSAGEGVALTSLAHSDEFIANSGVQEGAAALEDAELVFVGYGIAAPEYQWDDYKGQDLAGKVLLMLNNDPEWDPTMFAGETRLYYGRWTYKYEEAARQGAAGAIIIHTDPSAGYPWQVVQSSWGGPQFELPAEDEPRVQVKGWVTEAAAAKVVELAGTDLAQLTESARSRDFEPVPLGVTTSIDLPTEISRTETANVGGLLPGSDPELGDEIVVYTAHHDHLGTGEPNDEGDGIYNGARDNASGTSAVLAIAEAFTRLPEAPARSVLFLFVAAEEQGLLGSRYYALHPSIPPGKIAANINIDGANIWGRTRDITYIGHGKSSLDQVVEAFAGIQGRTVKPDQFPDRGFFYRSDQFNFAKIGVPAIYLDDGTDFPGRPEGWGREQIERWTEVHYHQPSDELTDDWNFDGMVEDTRLLFHIGAYLAATPEMPTWNPGDEFEAARQQALAAE
ncbi:MAG: M28 family metallopeptidase [Thermoanaerobaculia bacterium]